MKGLASKKTSPTYYQAYLVRLWRNEADEPWRVIATHVGTGEQHHFTNLEAFLTFMEQVGIEEAGAPENHQP